VAVGLDIDDDNYSYSQNNCDEIFIFYDWPNWVKPVFDVCCLFITTSEASGTECTTSNSNVLPITYAA
jgi:hypothetical protein